MIRRRCVWLFGLLGWCGLQAASLAQQALPPDVVVILNEGIHHYLQGADEDLTLAIDRFTSVLESEPRNTAALLFRALSLGQRGLLARTNKQRSRDEVARYTEVLDARVEPERLEKLQREIQEAEALLADERTSSGERRVAEFRLDLHRALQRLIEFYKGEPEEKLHSAREEARRRARDAAGRERDFYRGMIENLSRLMGLLDRPEAVVRLLAVVAGAKVARIDEEEARDVLQGDVEREKASGPPNALRDAAAARLRDAADMLESLLGEELDEPTRVRTRFFLGVLRFRQGVPLRARTETPVWDDRTRRRLGEAKQIMAELADDPATEEEWRSYAALYLGIIIPFQAAAEGDTGERNRTLDDAERRLKEALELDARVGNKASRIPDLVWRQRKLIAELREAPSAFRTRNDLSLSLFAGVRRDTNVVLLGERTDLPRGISRERDFGFTAGASLDYTWDISERVTLGLQARTSQLWHLEIDEFDQQTYGGSVALQYQAMPEADDVGPMYWALQYDGDYTLLGRSGFLQSHALTPSWRMHWAARRARTDVFLTYDIRDYSEPLFDRRFNRDGTYITVGLSQRVKAKEMTAVYKDRGWEVWGLSGDETREQDDPDYPERYLTPYAMVAHSWDATAGDEFDRKKLALLLGVELPLPWGLDFDATVLFEWQRYSRGSLVDFHRRRRRDLLQEYAVALSRTFVLRAGVLQNRYTPAFDRLLMTVRAHATWTGDDSNVVDRFGQAVFEYERTVFGLNVVFTFN